MNQTAGREKDPAADKKTMGGLAKSHDLKGSQNKLTAASEDLVG